MGAGHPPMCGLSTAPGMVRVYLHVLKRGHRYVVGTVLAVLFLFFLVPRQVFHDCEHGHAKSSQEHPGAELHARCDVCDLVLPVPLLFVATTEHGSARCLGTLGILGERAATVRQVDVALGRGPPMTLVG